MESKNHNLINYSNTYKIQPYLTPFFLHPNNNNNGNNIIINNTSRENECNCKTKIKCLINALCNLENVVYQRIIFPKENVKSTKTYIGISSMK